MTVETRNCPAPILGRASSLGEDAAACSAPGEVLAKADFANDRASYFEDTKSADSALLGEYGRLNRSVVRLSSYRTRTQVYGRARANIQG